MSSSPSPLASVVVVTWNGRRHLASCLDALQAQTFKGFETIVVDNGSSDGSAELIETQYPSVRLIRSATNLGFAGGNNLGIRSSNTLYVVTLNNDTTADPGWLGSLIEAAEGNPELGSVASKMVFAHDPATINSCGIALDPAGIAWDLWGGYPAAAVDRPHRVFGACGGAALYRRAMLDDVGVFDEDFFAYLEDVDLAWRARLRGWDSVLAPEALVLHAHSGTLGEGSPLKRFLLARNKVWTVVKCAPDPDFWRWLPVIATYDVGAATFGAARQRDWASVRGRLAALRNLDGALRKRRDIQARRSVHDGNLQQFYTPLAPPWDVPRRYRHLVADRTAPKKPSPAGKNEPHASPRSLVRRAGLQAAGLSLPARPTTRRAEIKIAVVRPDHLGDLLLSRPALELLRGALPSAEITAIIGPWAAASLQGLDVRVITFDYPAFTRASKASALEPYTAMVAFATQLREGDYDAALILRPDHWWGAWAAALAGVPRRVGHATPDTAPFLTHAIRGHEAWHSAESSVRAAEELLRALDVDVPARHRASTQVRFPPSARATAAVDAWIREHSLEPRGFVILHPGAGAAVKTWPSHRWVEVCRSLPSDSSLVLTGVPSERPLIEAIADGLDRPATVVVDFEWDELAALYCRARLVLGMDSGPLHLATAVGTQTVRIYGPTDQIIYGPAGDPACHRGLQSALPCVPCRNLVSPPCGHLLDPPCLAFVSVEQVTRAIAELPITELR